MYSRGGRCTLPLFVYLNGYPYSHSGILCLVEIPVMSKAFFSGMAKGVWGRERTLPGLRISWCAYLKKLSPSPSSHYTNCLRRHLGPLHAPVCGPHQSDGDPNIDVSARHQVWLTPMFCEATGYPFQVGHCIHLHQPVGVGNEGREVSTLLVASLKIHLFLHPIFFL